MSARQRITFGAIAALIAIVAVIVLAGGPDEETERADRPPSVTPTATAESTASPEETETAEPTPEPTPEAPEIKIEGGKVKGGEAEIDVEEGDTVRFSVMSDTADHVHVHGYDVLRDVTPGKTVRFSFKATITGVFEVELENAGLPIARIRVRQ